MKIQRPNGTVRFERGEEQKMERRLIPASRNPYRISKNERAKLPTEFLERNDLVPGESLVWLYIEVESGDLLVSAHDYRVAIERPM